MLSALVNQPQNMVYLHSQTKRQVKINNCILSNAESVNFKQKEIDNMRYKIMELKNVRERKDGRYEWRKMVSGITHQIIESCPRAFFEKHRDYQKRLKSKGNVIKIVKPKESRRLIDLAWTWYNLNKKGKIKSEKQYEIRLNNYISKLDKGIDTYTKNDIIEFLNGLDGHRTREYCFQILTNVFAEAAESGITKRNVIGTLKNSRGKIEKGIWYNPAEQKLIYKNRHKSIVGHEIEFILLVGCRLSETFNCRLELDKLRVWVERSKVDGTSGYVNISAQYAKHLKKHWNNMFKLQYHVYAREFNKLLALLEINKQPNEKPLHRLRHTFATNIYYLGANDKRRSHLMGHKCTRITNDVYTDFELDITKQDILDVYGSLYPEFS